MPPFRKQTVYRVGDVVLYDSRELGTKVLHRIVRIEGGRFVLKGDNNSFPRRRASDRGADRRQALDVRTGHRPGDGVAAPAVAQCPPRRHPDRARRRSHGGNADELVLGLATADSNLRGQNGSDCIVGGGGNDTLRGDNGTDVCIGGPGTDTFHATCETQIQ